MVRHLRALRVHHTASRMLETGRLKDEPAWYRVVAAIPPTTTLVRSLPADFSEQEEDPTSTSSSFQKPNKTRRGRKPNGLFRPQEIVYPEDRLRQRFFRDHPWELARPRILVENDGNDHKGWDWAGIRQRGKALDGESVIQRQRYLMTHESLPESDAYDRARKEFYDLRMAEDIERRVALEEALAVGAEFGKSYIDIGVEMEHKVLLEWREKAVEDILLRRHRQMAAYSSSVEEDETPAADAAAVDALEGSGDDVAEGPAAAVAAGAA
ncbi:mitochondrial ribosomal small subunit component [Rhizina undulata]